MPYGKNLYRGVILIILGILFFLGTIGVIEFPFGTYWPVLVVLLGIEYLFLPKQ